jgi:deoxyribose-phosphate aldolase
MDVANRIEATLLRPDSTENEVRRLCMAARDNRLAAVGVPPVWARFAVIALAGSPVRVSVPVGYPLGTHTASVKGLEARLALEEGAGEVTFVPNLTALKSGHRLTFSQDVAYVVKQCHLVNPDALVKVLIYGDLLSLDEQREAVRVVQESGGRFLVLGTYAPRPLAPAQAQRFREILDAGTQAGVMGEVHSLEEARPFLDLGIARLATPWGLDIVIPPS